MRRWTWLAVLAVVAVLAALSGTAWALANGPVAPQSSSDNGGWQGMVEFCHGPGGMMGGWGGFHGADPVTLERVAGVLGLTYEELTGRLAQGETLAQVAQAQGVDTSLVITTILAPWKETLEVRVKYGYLSESEAQALLERAREGLEQTLQTPLYGGSTAGPGYTLGQDRGPGGGMMGGGMMGGGMMGGGMMGGGMMGGGMMGW